VPHRSGRSLLWMAAVVVVVSIVSPKGIPSAMAMSRHAPTHVAAAGTVSDRDSLQARAKPTMTNPFESLRAGVVDENIPP
jgi:hypothetical protein